MAFIAHHFPRAAAKEKPIELMGNVKQVLPGTMIRVALPNGHEALEHISGKMGKNFIRISIGDQVMSKCRPTTSTRRALLTAIRKREIR